MSGVIVVQKMAERALGVKLTFNQSSDLRSECRVNLGQQKLRDTIKVVESSESARLDTREREDMLVAFAQVLTTDREWPCYGDDLEQAQAFHQKLGTATQEREYTRV
jgi:hypothetical protein